MQNPPRTAVTGVTGFLGRGLPALLAARGVAVTGVSRSGGGEIPGVDRWQTPDTMDFSGCSAVINLAGEPINRRWNAAAKREFHESRVAYTGRVVAAIAKAPPEARPSVLVNASAIGIYGDREDETLTEKSRPAKGYLADLCRDWEDAALDAESLGVRVVCLRIGLVLGKGGGSWQQLAKVFKAGLGGQLGNGRQWMSWIHLEDLRAAIIHAVFSGHLSGAVNATAPNPERNRHFTRKLAASLHRPALLHAPAFALRLALGEFAGVVLASQKVMPSALEEDGFAFRHAFLESALADLTG